METEAFYEEIRVPRYEGQLRDDDDQIIWSCGHEHRKPTVAMDHARLEQKRREKVKRDVQAAYKSTS